MSLIESTILELLETNPELTPKQLIQTLVWTYHWDEFDVRNALWKITADGIAEFNPGFTKVTLTNK
jgi:hypothetical protein